MAEITIKFNAQQVEVFYKGRYSDSSAEVAYVDKHTSMEDIAQGFLEVVAALQVECEFIRE